MDKKIKETLDAVRKEALKKGEVSSRVVLFRRDGKSAVFNLDEMPPLPGIGDLARIMFETFIEKEDVTEYILVHQCEQEERNPKNGHTTLTPGIHVYHETKTERKGYFMEADLDIEDTIKKLAEPKVLEMPMKGPLVGMLEEKKAESSVKSRRKKSAKDPIEEARASFEKQFRASSSEPKPE